MPTVLGSVEINKNTLCVSLYRDKCDKAFMIAYVIPMEFGTGLTLPKNRKIPSEYIPDIITVCNCIDKTIRATQGVDLVYWFFEWMGKSSKPVWTLNELSWDE